MGLILLIRDIFNTLNGRLVIQFFGNSKHTAMTYLYTLALGTAIPFHVIAVGLILKKRYLSPLWSRVAWFAVVISGCWLGISLLIRRCFLDN